jgi:CPA1 family monovalent cation:H+ antiporter
MQLDSKLITHHRWSITYAATVGTAISVGLTGLVIWAFLNLVNLFIGWDFGITIIAAFLFAAIVAPTDSVAVMSIMRRIKLNPPIKAYISGEALFNDATAIVLFLLISQFAHNPDSIQPGSVLLEFLWIAGGAVVLGLCTGFLGAYLVDTTERGTVSVLLTIGIALGTGGLADALGTSNAIAVAVAGLTFVQRRSEYTTKRDAPIHEFWTTIDGIVNPLFFALIGLELLVVSWNLPIIVAAIFCAPAIVIARYASLLLPWLAIRRQSHVSHAALLLMTWIGIRGGVSFALALSIPSESEYRVPAITGTFVVVVLSVLIQGLSVPTMARRLGPALSKSK